MGNVNDIPSWGGVSNPSINVASNHAGCLLSGELKPQWLLVTIGQAGFLEFVFGAANSANPQAGFYDWAMWPYSTATCSRIKNNLLPPIRCNWNGSPLGGTGIASTGNIPPGGAANNYEPPLPVVACEQFIICISNFSGINSLISFQNLGTAQLSCDPYCLTVSNAEICKGFSATFSVSTPMNLTNVTFSANPGNLSSAGSTFVVTPTISTTYTVYASGLNYLNLPVTQAGLTTVTVNPTPELSISPVSSTICLNGKATLQVIGTGTSYLWSPSILITGINGTTITTSPTSSQTYSVFTSVKGCTNSATAKIEVAPLPLASLQVSRSRACLYDSITLYGFGAAYYSWQGPHSSISFGGQTVSFAGKSQVYSGVYKLTVTDLNSCSSSTTTTLSFMDPPYGHFTATNLKSCIPFRSDFTFHISNSYDSLILKSWELNKVPISSLNTFSCNFKEAGNYIISGKFTDTLTHCANTTSILVEAYALPKADFIFSPVKPVENTEEVVFTDLSSGENIVDYNWSFINNNEATIKSKSASWFFKDAGIFPVALTVKNARGCSDTSVKFIEVDMDVSVFIPNAFTPNEDGLNDLFQPVIRGSKLYHLSVLNRWGNLVFETDNLSQSWDGSFRGIPCEEGTYVWKLSLSLMNGESKKMSGHLNLYR